MVYECVHMFWETSAEESTLIFYENGRQIHSVTVTDDWYRLMDSAEWLEGVSDMTNIQVEV